MKSKSKKTEKIIDVSKIKIGIVVSSYHHKITEKLKLGAIESLLLHGILVEHIHFLEVPGAFELVAGADKLNRLVQPDGIIILGCVIKGDTEHDTYINHAVAQGIITLTIQEKKPFAFGLLTTNNLKQAKDRSGGKLENKGEEAASALLGLLTSSPNIVTL